MRKEIIEKMLFKTLIAVFIALFGSIACNLTFAGRSSLLGTISVHDETYCFFVYGFIILGILQVLFPTFVSSIPRGVLEEEKTISYSDDIIVQWEIILERFKEGKSEIVLQKITSELDKKIQEKLKEAAKTFLEIYFQEGGDFKKIESRILKRKEDNDNRRKKLEKNFSRFYGRWGAFLGVRDEQESLSSWVRV